MEVEYQLILDEAQKREDAIFHFFQKMKAREPRDFDQQMTRFHHEAFETIDCLKCANCCKTLGPSISQKDIETAAKALKIKPAVFMETYLRKDEDNDLVFKEMPCAFLGADNHCSIYDVRPKACREYPHTDKPKMLSRRYITMNNATVCPAVATILKSMMVHYKFSW